MGDARIKIARDKAELVQNLLASEDTTGPFQTYADIVTFAASLGFNHHRRIPLEGEISKRDPAPIHRETFTAKGFDMILNLIAVADINDPRILASDDKSASEKLKIFEEYANGGLTILQKILEGNLDLSLELLNELSRANKNSSTEEEFDLSKFL
jgi:dnd system-associated protein 4